MSQNEPSDLELISLILSGQKDAYSVLVNRHKDTIFNLVYRMTGNIQDTQDLSQDVFLQAYKKLKEFKLAYKFSNWLYTIALNITKNYLRRKNFLKIIHLDKLIETEDDEIQLEIPANEDTVEDALIKKEEREQIFRMLKKLPVKYKNVMFLRYMENLSYKEISQIAGLPIGTVETYIFRGHNWLMEKFSQDLK